MAFFVNEDGRIRHSTTKSESLITPWLVIGFIDHGEFFSFGVIVIIIPVATEAVAGQIIMHAKVAINATR